jgi:quinol monooxygenase YgiN
VQKILVAEFTVRPGGEARVAELVRSLAEQVRGEPGNVLFEVHTRADDPRSYWVYEVYRDEAAFQAHLAAPHGARFNAQLQDLIEEDGSVLTFLTRAG